MDKTVRKKSRPPMVQILPGARETDGDDDHVEPNPGNPSTQRSRKQTLIKKMKQLAKEHSANILIYFAFPNDVDYSVDCRVFGKEAQSFSKRPANQHLNKEWKAFFQLKNLQRAQVQGIQPRRDIVQEEDDIEPGLSNNNPMPENDEPDETSIQTAEELLRSCETNELTLHIIEETNTQQPKRKYPDEHRKECDNIDAIINSVAEGLSENAARNISLWSFIKLAILGLDLINVNRTTNSRNECTTLPECGRNENLEETHQLGSDAGSSESGCPNNLVSIFLTSCPKLHVVVQVHQTAEEETEPSDVLYIRQKDWDQARTKEKRISSKRHFNHNLEEITTENSDLETPQRRVKRFKLV